MTTCSLCQGAQNLIAFNKGRPEWWPCPCCDGDGTTQLFSLPTIKINDKQSKMSRKWGKGVCTDIRTGRTT